MNFLQHPLREKSKQPSPFNTWLLQRIRHRRQRKPRPADLEPPVAEPHPEVKAMQERVAELQKQLAEEQELSSRRKADHESAVAENDHLKTRLTQLDSLPHQVKETQRKLEQEKEAAHKAWELYESATATVQQLQERLAQIEEDAKRSSVRVSELERAHADAERQRRDSVDQLKARTTELQNAQRFLTKVDDITDAEVTRLVGSLNGQIKKTAAAIASAPHFAFESLKDPVATEKAVKRIEHYSWLGPSLVSALGIADHTRSNALVQTALQAGMAAYARWLATSWELGVVDPRGLLEGVYLQIRDKEPQPVAGRWRALCRTYVKGLLETGETQTQRLFKTLSGIVADVLVICGVVGTWEGVSDTVAQAFESELYEIVNLALQFQWTAGERIVSQDFIVFVTEPDVTFNPTHMEDELAGERRKASSIRKGSVLCTTHLGLMAERKVGGKDEVGDVRSTVLLKPKVVLKTVFSDR